MEKKTIIYGVDNFYELEANSWGGAIQTLDRVKELGKENEFLELINEVIGEGMDETDLNDYIWFDVEEDLKDFYNIDLYED